MMEVDTSTVPPKPPRLPVEEETPAPEVLEVKGGAALEAIQKSEEPEDLWPMEEGDDSVFYSDDEQPKGDTTLPTYHEVAAESKKTVNSVAEDEAVPQEEKAAEESTIKSKHPEMEKKSTPQACLTEQAENLHDLQRAEPNDEPDPAGLEVKSDQNQVKFLNECEDADPLNCSISDNSAQQEANQTAGKANLPVQKEVVVPDTQKLNLEHSDASNDERNKAKVPISSKKQQLQMDQKPEKNQKLSLPAGFHQNPNPSYGTLPHPKKSSQQKSFDHLTSSKYSTMSYRRIRRGNTRKKIEEFEFMIMNL